MWLVLIAAAWAAPKVAPTEVPPSAGCASPFHPHADVLFPLVPTVLPRQGMCHQFYDQQACCLSTYTLAVAAQVNAAEQRTALFEPAKRNCVDKLLEFYVGAACSLCDPGWARYASHNSETHQWVLTVQQENCHYIWSACESVVDDKYTEPQFCEALTHIRGGDVEEIFGDYTPTEPPKRVVPTEPPTPVVAVVRHAKTRHVRHVRHLRHAISTSLLAARTHVTHTVRNASVETGAPAATAEGAAEAAADIESADDDGGADGDDSDDAEDLQDAVNGMDDDVDEMIAKKADTEAAPTDTEEGFVVHDKDPASDAVSNATAPSRPEVNVSGNASARWKAEAAAQGDAVKETKYKDPCHLPFPALAFSPLPQALSAVDEGQFGGYRRSSAPIAALLALTALFS